MIQTVTAKFIGLVACIAVFLSFPQNSLAKVSPSPQQILNDIHLDDLGTHYEIRHVIVQNRCAYILATASEQGKTMLHLREVSQNVQGKWSLKGGVGIQVVDKPWRLFRKRANLKYSLSRSYGYDRIDDAYVHFDWCLFGYTTDPTVTTFRIKTKTGYVPLDVIDKRYFMRILTSEEQKNFIEVQGLDSHGNIVQRDNGTEDEFKDREWSPRHSEFT
ncbi:hypothetical protein [Alicyclobacillus mengziensis]|uniref:Uncharacterized protein n=1 Tax=Alicyclobacillus mengziensis TaxID=2931921 RepID=A0A9X7VX79_9BACL|nr:hypothetical protein [Alicyclobacillus mengziensis]QSO46736.1 hypothetical protein JZ786_20200 [Alicyclobacillus mengziensis]